MCDLDAMRWHTGRVQSVVGAIVATAAISACGSDNGGGGNSQPEAVPYSFANFVCLEETEVQDGGKSLVVDLAPAVSVASDFDQAYLVECVRTVTVIPDHVQAQMNQTTALQGRQTAEWDVKVADIPEPQIKTKPMADGTLSASWTYHPDNGLDVIFTVKD
jgi:hypothetical protein